MLQVLGIYSNKFSPTNAHIFLKFSLALHFSISNEILTSCKVSLFLILFLAIGIIQSS